MRAIVIWFSFQSNDRGPKTVDRGSLRRSIVHRPRSSTSFRHFDSLQHGAGLVDRFLVFGGRVGIGYDPGAGLHADGLPMRDQRADGDAGVHGAVETKVADHARIGAARLRL